MIKVTMQPTVDFDDISAELGVDLSDCHFTEMVKNGSYVSLDCSDEAVEELKDTIEYVKDHRPRECKKYLNDLYIITELRHMGYKNSILVFIFW